MRKLLLFAVASAMLIVAVSAHADPTDTGCAASGSLDTSGGCTLFVSCDGVHDCVWDLDANASGLGVVRADIVDGDGVSYAGCVGVSYCDAAGRIVLPPGAMQTLSCTITSVSYGLSYACRADPVF